MYQYKLTNTKESSSKYGNCDVCGKHVSEVYSQIEEKEYHRPDGSLGYTHHDCHSYFGHEECLTSKQR